MNNTKIPMRIERKTIEECQLKTGDRATGCIENAVNRLSDDQGHIFQLKLLQVNLKISKVTNAEEF